MGKPSEIESLAQRFLNLWQEQVAAMAVDPEFVASAERLLTTLNPALQEGTAGGESANSDKPDRATATGAASDARDDGLRRIERRLAALEERVATLEPVAEGRRGSSRGGGREERS
jgi:hypothetical protein